MIGIARCCTTCNVGGVGKGKCNKHAAQGVTLFRRRRGVLFGAEVSKRHARWSVAVRTNGPLVRTGPAHFQLHAVFGDMIPWNSVMHGKPVSLLHVVDMSGGM